MKTCYPATKRTLQQYTDQTSEDDGAKPLFFPRESNYHKSQGKLKYIVRYMQYLLYLTDLIFNQHVAKYKNIGLQATVVVCVSTENRCHVYRINHGRASNLCMEIETRIHKPIGCNINMKNATCL
jgi:glutamine synthetase